MRSITLTVLIVMFIWTLCAQTAVIEYGKLDNDQLRILADKNDVEACYQLGMNYYSDAEAAYEDYYYYYDEYDYEDYDASTDSDYAAALKWFIKAGDLGNITAQNYVGIMYKNGEGTARNYSEAFKWYSKAAAKGNRYSQYNLGNSYAEGWLGPKNEAKASEWYLKAAENMHPWSQGIIAQRYADGTGLTKDIKKAYFWAYIAFHYGDTEVQNAADTILNDLLSTLTNDQSVKIIKDAEAWIENHPEPED